MNIRSLSTTSTLLAALLLAALGTTPVRADDESTAKLKELERAMSEPKSESAPAMPGAKRRTRAIVFDNAPQDAAMPEPAKAVKAGPADCGTLPTDVKAKAVDFAIQFKVGSADLTPAAEQTLSDIGKILSMAPDRCILVEGHTDSTGNADKNLALSRDRAASVVRFIAEKGGVDRKRLVPSGKGSSDPLNNLDPRDPKNRRVVFKVVVG